MTLSITLTLFIAMVVLAILPGPGILVVVARAMSQGFYAGVMASIGIVAGDFVFICLAVYGLSSLSELMGDFFLLVKYAGAAYLIWLGLKIIAPSNPAKNVTVSSKINHSANFFAGLLTTLANPKAILFYVSFFPAFLDLSQVGYYDLAIILIVAATSVGGVMIAYAYLAANAGARVLNGALSKYIKFGAGGMLVGSGFYIAARS